MSNRLKQLLNINPEDLTFENQKELFNEIKNASLLLAIDSESKPLKLKYEDSFFTPIFTDEEEIKKFGAISFIRYANDDLIDLLSLEDDLDNVVINPASDNPFGLSLDFFISNCKEDKFKQLSELVEVVKSGVLSLDEITIFYLREQTPFIFENSVDGIFSSSIPLCVSSIEEFNNFYSYLNIMYVPKGILFGQNNLNDLGDIVLAPTIKFKLIEKKEDNTFIWQCIEQDFNIY